VLLQISDCILDICDSQGNLSKVIEVMIADLEGADAHE